MCIRDRLYIDGKVEEAVATLIAKGHTYEEGGALWLRLSLIHIFIFVAT